MVYYIYSLAIPLAIIFISLLMFKSLSSFKVTKALTIALILLIIYALLIYLLEMENYVDTEWTFYTLLMLLIPFIILVSILNLIAWKRK